MAFMEHGMVVILSSLYINDTDAVTSTASPWDSLRLPAAINEACALTIPVRGHPRVIGAFYTVVSSATGCFFDELDNIMVTSSPALNSVVVSVNKKRHGVRVAIQLYAIVPSSAEVQPDNPAGIVIPLHPTLYVNDSTAVTSTAAPWDQLRLPAAVGEACTLSIPVPGHPRVLGAFYTVMSSATGGFFDELDNVFVFSPGQDHVQVRVQKKRQGVSVCVQLFAVVPSSSLPNETSVPNVLTLPMHPLDVHLLLQSAVASEAVVPVRANDVAVGGFYDVVSSATGAFFDELDNISVGTWHNQVVLRAQRKQLGVKACIDLFVVVGDGTVYCLQHLLYITATGVRPSSSSSAPPPVRYVNNALHLEDHGENTHKRQWFGLVHGPTKFVLKIPDNDCRHLDIAACARLFPYGNQLVQIRLRELVNQGEFAPLSARWGHRGVDAIFEIMANGAVTSMSEGPWIYEPGPGGGSSVQPAAPPPQPTRKPFLCAAGHVVGQCDGGVVGDHHVFVHDPMGNWTHDGCTRVHYLIEHTHTG